MELNQQIQEAAQLIRDANHCMAMTGAGISTPSGIPDFRSPDSGVWKQVDPLTVASIHAFRQNPQNFYDWIHPLSKLLITAEPNPAHSALVTLESKGKLKGIITQNIDDLHGKAGSKTVYELHGHLRKLTCIQCYQVQSGAGVLEKFVKDRQIPKCNNCGAVLKPNVILFGEQLPMQEFVAAQVALEDADLLLVAGSSLEVAPASDLPPAAIDNGAKLIIVNSRPTYLDSKADIVIHGDVADILPRIAELVSA